MNPAEGKTWRAFRIYGKGKVSFRRQHPAAGFFIDFYCSKARLGLELDGASHHGNEESDERRTRILQSHGIEILRVPNRFTDEGNLDALAEWFVEECLERIKKAEN